jgi:hypothetical protein
MKDLLSSTTPQASIIDDEDGVFHIITLVSFCVVGSDLNLTSSTVEGRTPDSDSACTFLVEKVSAV